MQELISFHGKQEIKDKLLQQLHAHAAADQIVRGCGYYDSNDNKGCGVGCTIHSSNHFFYETRYGIPYGIARAEDTIFETLEIEAAKKWPIELIEAIPVGKCLDNVTSQYNIWRITDEKYGLIYKYNDSPIKELLTKLVEVLNKVLAGTWTKEDREADIADIADIAYIADIADIADIAYRADIADIAYRADIADIAYRADIADIADIAYRADRADIAYRAYIADRADIADRTDIAAASRAKLLDLLKAA